MNKRELIFIPSPGAGHLVSTVEMAKLLVQRDQRLYITVLIMKFPLDSKIDAYTEKLSADPISDRMKFISLPEQNVEIHPKTFLNSFIEKQKPHVKEVVKQLNSGSNSPKLAGFVIDMFCTCMIDIANELGVPTYLFFTSSAGFLSLSFYLQTLDDEHKKDITEFKDSDAELPIPGIHNKVPANVLPSVTLNSRESAEMMLGHTRRFRETKGIMINTFNELEPSVVEVLFKPPVYPVGPILNLNDDGVESQGCDIIKWLDDQPPQSVVLLCFGSMGAFEEDQIREIAIALENSGYRFLWTLRKPPPKGKIEAPSEYSNVNDVLPEGFLDRTAGIGKIAGWVPQVKVLAHPSIGGFVSHCGWNSTLESIWFGVPIAAWPLYAEQQFNAFCLLKEYGIAEEIKMDYRRNPMVEKEVLVSAEVIERGIRSLMGMDVEKRKKMKDISQLSRKALDEGGSSHMYLGRFIDDVLNNMP